MISRVHRSFIQLVFDERGDRIRITPDQLAEGHLYTGVEAVEYGLADGIGSDGAAIARAAELAGLSDYDVADVNLLVLREALLALRSELPPAEDGAAPTLWTGKGWADGYDLPLSLLTESAPGETPPGFPAGGEPGDGWTEPPVDYSPNRYSGEIAIPENDQSAGSQLRGNVE